MPVTWKDGKPYGKCGIVTWYCPYDSNHPSCCQYEDYLASLKRGEVFKMERNYKEALDKEYGPAANAKHR